MGGSRSNKFFNTKNIAGTALFIALAYAVSFLEFPVFAGAPFLKLDFSGVFLLLCGFMYGPVFGFIAIVIKEALRVFTTSTGGIGEIVNAVVYMAFVLFPAVCYKYKKGFKLVVLYLGIGSLLQLGAAMFTNRFITFPLYGTLFGFDGVDLFRNTWHLVLFFNLIKSAALSVITILLYKRIKFLFEKAGTSVQKLVKHSDIQIPYVSKSALNTETFAKNFAKSLKKGDVLVLSGELGAGKTTFVKGLAKGLGIAEEVTSPTYAYLNVYGNYLYHYDFYRLTCGEEAERLGLIDYFAKDNICVLEWAENIKDAISINYKTVRIEKISDKKRRITVE